MSAHSEHDPSSTHKRSLLRVAWSVFVIVCIAFTVGDWAKRFYEMATEKKEKPSSMAVAMDASVNRRIEELKQVDATGLMGVLSNTLETNECDWLFQCTSIRHEIRRPTLQSLAEVAKELGEAPEPTPQLYYHPAGPIFIPTAHTIRGLPQAVWRTGGAIWDAGAWAVLMFGSCTMIWAVILTGMAKGENSAWPVYVLVVGAPVWITLMVMVVQWVGEGTLHVLGSGAASVMMWAAPGGAVASLIIEIPHILKAPHEVREAAEVFKKI